jgi:AraC-like DNA-binding protein
LTVIFSPSTTRSPRTRDADDNLRHLMRQLLVIELVNHQSRYRLEANRWLSEIALLLATRFTRPVIARTQRGAEKWSRRIARGGADRRQLSAAAFATRCRRRGICLRSLAIRLFRKEVGVSFVQYITALRLNKAAEQLLTTRKSVQQIARSRGSPAPAS